MTYHKTSYNRWKSNSHGKVMSFDLFDKYGFDNCVITLIEHVKANTKEELLQKERYYIQSMKCINEHGYNNKKCYWPLLPSQNFLYRDLVHDFIFQPKK